MFALAWLLLPDLPEYRTGLIIVGLARCIAMVIIWNDLACGDREAAAVLVALNSIFQVLMFAVLGWFYLSVLPGWLGLEQANIATSPWQIAEVGPRLPRHPAARRVPVAAVGRTGQGSRLVRVDVPAEDRSLGPIRPAVHHRGAVRAAGGPDHQPPAGRRPHRAPALGLLRHHVGRRVRGRGRAGTGLRVTTTLAFTAAGNNFELAIAVAIATYGATSGQALAGVVGPLIEVPVLVALVYVSLALRKRFGGNRIAAIEPSTAAGAER